MKVHDLAQGSPEWHQFRLEHFGASEAAAMLGLSDKVKRTELLRMKHTGNAKEFSDWVQANILDYGHEVEALARPIKEDDIGEDLYPVTCSEDEGRISASLDGLTMSEETAWEHKQWNEALAASVLAGIVPDTHMPQCQQELMVTGAAKLIFTVSDGTADKMVSTEVLPSQDWFDRIRAGWAQFEKDLAEYVPVDYAEKPAADTIMRLPALAVQIRGEVVLSNLPQFKEAAVAFIAGIKTELETDEDFSNAEATVKFCEEAEKNLELTKSAALGQTASIDDLMKTIDFIQAELRTKRLALNRLVTTKKASIKESVLVKARTAYLEHIEALEAEIKPVKLDIEPRPDFIGAAKNKRTLASLHDAVDTELANAKIAADAVAKDIRAKLAWYKTNAEGYGFLFSDLATITLKATDDFYLLVNTRITEHKAAEDKKRKEDADKLAQQQVAAQPTPLHGAHGTVVYTAAGQPAFTPRTAPTTPVDDGVRLRLGEINSMLSPISLTTQGLADLGFEHVATDKNAKLYRESDFPGICNALINHIEAISQTAAA